MFRLGFILHSFKIEYYGVQINEFNRKITIAHFFCFILTAAATTKLNI